MQTILILGAGKSSTYLIDFLSDSCTKKRAELILADIDLETALSKLKKTGQVPALRNWTLPILKRENP